MSNNEQSLNNFYLMLQENGIECFLNEEPIEPCYGEMPESLMFNEEDFSPIETFDEFINLLKESDNNGDVTKFSFDFSELKQRIDNGDDSCVDSEFIGIFEKEANGAIVGDFFVGNATDNKFSLSSLILENDEAISIMDDKAFNMPLSDVYLITIRNDFIYVVICDLDNMPLKFLKNGSLFETHNKKYYAAVIRL